MVDSSILLLPIGCPFKLFDAPHLASKLRSMHYPDNAAVPMSEVIETAGQGHCQIACQKYFMAKHPGAAPEKVGNHPNSYFAESRRYHELNMSTTIVKGETN